jgi:hypothetical protein
MRASFVVTIATSLVAGCGARVDDASTTTSDGDGGTRSTAPDEAGGTTEDGCPRPRPTTGRERCDESDPYGGRAESYWCKDGKWVLESISCNPPEPRCPPEFPELGTSCPLSFRYPDGMICSYLDDCGGEKTRAVARCVEGRWSAALEEGSCPDTLPYDGSSCATCLARKVAGPCTYPALGSRPTMNATCDPKTRTWKVEGPPAP